MSPKTKYPRGKLNEDDEGEVSMAIAVDQDCVVIAFPKPVQWCAFSVEQAEELAVTILARAKDARRNRQ